MDSKDIEETRFFSKRKGELAKGCRLCVRGEKSVLFITGVCPRNCFYCPISDKKKNLDVKYINERKYDADDELLEEIKLSGSKGVGITGGDPLSRLERTVNAIKLLKEKFGKDFHIHLYTSLDLVTNENLKELYDAGLDEIRFHADLDNDKLWDKIKLAKHFEWDIGIEIPAIPDKEEKSKQLVEQFKDVVDFFNFNELEISDLNAEEFQNGGYELKDDTSYAVKGSEDIGIELLKISNRGHFCTCKLKDRIQLGNRIINRAQIVKKQFDIVDEEGMLTRGAVYINAAPIESYEKIFAKVDKQKEIKLLKELKKELQTKFRLASQHVFVDDKKLRLLVGAGVVRRMAKEIKNKCAIVTEYPTYDNMEIELEFLN